jgi:hypothetical protein
MAVLGAPRLLVVVLEFVLRLSASMWTETCAEVILPRSGDSKRDSSGCFLVPFKVHPRRGHEGPAGE